MPPTDELRSIIGDPKDFPSYPAALVMVGLEGVEDVLLAVDGVPCPLLICHYRGWKTKNQNPTE